MLIICTSCANAYRSDYFVQSIFSMSVKEISMDRTLIINQVEIAFVMPYHWPIHSIPPVTAIAPSFSSLLVSYPRQQEHSPHTNLSWPLMWLYFSFNPPRPAVAELARQDFINFRLVARLTNYVWERSQCRVFGA